jgi:hypothetical protein
MNKPGKPSGHLNATAGRNRGLYQLLQAKYAKKAGAVITPGYLRLESAALGTQGSVGFSLLNNQNAPLATQINETEVRLALTDKFLVTEVGFYVLKVTTAGTNRGDVLRTWNNSQIFSKSGEAAAMMNMWNGRLAITINSINWFTTWDLMRHYRVGNAQKGVLTAATGTGNAWDQNTWDQASYGMFPTTPTIEFSGADTTGIQINCPANVDMTGTSSTNYAVIIFRGFLAQNASKVAG